MFVAFHSGEDASMSNESSGKKKFNLKIAIIGAVGALILIVGGHFMLLAQHPMHSKAPVVAKSAATAPSNPGN